MFYALRDSHGRYVAENCTLSGSKEGVYITHTDNIYSARMSQDESTMKRYRTVVNKHVGEKPGKSWYRTGSAEAPVEHVEIVKFELKEVL